jgi:hypothetical protein
MERREEKGGGTGCCERGIEQARTSSSMDDMNAGPHDQLIAQMCICPTIWA